MELTNIKIEFLPPNTTVHLQSCNKGIINSFKAKYRKLLLQNRIKAFDFQQLTGNRILPDDTNSYNEIEKNSFSGPGIPPSEEQIIAILKENNTMSDDEGDKDIISVTSSKALIAFDTIFNYVEQNDNLFVTDKGSKLKSNNTDIDPVDNNTMNREKEGDNNTIIDIENFDFEALYFNEFDFYNYEEDQGFIEYQIDENSLYK
ncbi:unnamed protein product [Rhizophagus irregularis]|nr:unnamed protein product [Rhizophagus irregularis]